LTHVKVERGYFLRGHSWNCKSDGHDFIKEVIAKGAVAVVCEEMPAEMIPGITFVRVKDSSLCIGYHLLPIITISLLLN
jgi:UDP-N-acetylmuramyl pentapeptide synthase